MLDWELRCLVLLRAPGILIPESRLGHLLRLGTHWVPLFIVTSPIGGGVPVLDSYPTPLEPLRSIDFSLRLCWRSVDAVHRAFSSVVLAPNHPIAPSHRAARNFAVSLWFRVLRRPVIFRPLPPLLHFHFVAYPLSCSHSLHWLLSFVFCFLAVPSSCSRDPGREA